MCRHLIWLLTLGALALPTPALASKVEVGTASDCHGDIVCDKYAGGQPIYYLLFTSAETERNDVTMAPGADATHIVVTDAGAPLTPGLRCTARDEHAVVCDVTGYPLGTSSIALGDGDDRFTIAETIKAAVIVDAGAGDDEVHGGSGNDSLTGGPGRDTLTGGAGNDTFPQGTSIDTDVIDGGAGTNTVDYGGRTGPLRVHLTDPAATQGEPGETDMLTHLQNVTGGDGADDLSGDATANTLRGGAGDDVISGDAGKDEIYPGKGSDKVDAGAGNDYVDSTDGKPDTVACGAGRDEVGSLEYTGEYLDEPVWYGPDRADRLGADCETAWADGWQESDPLRVPIQLHRRGNIVTLANPCRASGLSGRCKGSVRIGTRTKRRFSRKGKQISVRLDRRDRAAARKGPIRLSILVDSYSVDFTAFVASR